MSSTMALFWQGPFFRQFWALCRKNWIVLSKHKMVRASSKAHILMWYIITWTAQRPAMFSPSDRLWNLLGSGTALSHQAKQCML